jgi:hypothetical protein
VQRVHSGSPVPVGPTRRQLIARRVEAARVLAGRPSLRTIAQQAGISYTHLVGVLNAHEHMTDTDARDLANVLSCPEAWLREGWDAMSQPCA